jgi:glutathione synthase/RimK-type ligase-like ATP-grasp enzyme
MSNNIIIFSARQDHDIIKRVIKELKLQDDLNFHFHDPLKGFFNLSRMPQAFKEAKLMFVKVRNDCSIDLLHYAKIHGIPTMHDVDTVLSCKNKVALDYKLRRIFGDHKDELTSFSLPASWNQNVKELDKFKKWALKKLPIVIKSHQQHDKFNRFNFLIREISEADLFYKKYHHLITYDVYVQKFIECDGIDRKVYVIGDNIFGIKRENPIYIYMRENPADIDVDTIKRTKFPITAEIKNLTRILSREMGLFIFGFDLIKPIQGKKYYLIDLNDFPGFQGIKDVEQVLADYIVQYAKEKLNAAE